jgi:catechol 2,3-dioxygenase-like lactoylglutathione lyase family enzyme
MLDDAVAFVPSSDLARARSFYEGLLGLDVIDVTPFALVLRSGATTIRVTLAEGWTPQPFTVLGWTVGDMTSEGARLRAAGVEFLRYPGMVQDGRGVWTTPGGDQVAWFADPDGNVLSITELVSP